ncbi:hypothetical protein I9W82_000660 [Candida metapsilosis]|uniref:Growth arrest-specific protein 8 domain-containing protein n=1 Tax=Candida metapsilosis TaxID=273372 RepID=A0A8H7ZJ13_9ASCO|nr:hypothetical protein I9W82_000660 [Candida metapsilosis]
MQGSSRSLVRALEAAFADKESSKLSDDDLRTTINEYLAKHNTYTTIRQSSFNIHEELYRLYNAHVKPSNKLEQEIKFVDVLTQVCGVFNEAEINLWISTYLKSTIDSAGYNMTFVSDSRKFIEKVLTEYTATECDHLNDIHQHCAVSLAQQLLDIYLNEDVLVSKMKLDVTGEKSVTQTHHERIRFIRSNCAKLLLNYGMKNINQYCNLLNQSILNTDHRFEAIILLGYLINSDVEHSSYADVSAVVETDLFQSLLRCLLFDLDPTIVHCALNDLLMLMPRANTTLGKYLSDILSVYVRITNWMDEGEPKQDRSLLNAIAIDTGSWRIASPFEAIVETSFNYHYLCTLIYGLFYFNFASFICDPIVYLSNHLPTVVSVELSHSQVSKESDPLTRAIRITKQLVQTFHVHPKYWIKSDLADELNHPVSWLPENASTEDIALACFAFSSDIVAKNDEPVSPQSPHAISVGGGTLSRSSSSAGPMYFQANGPSKQLMKSRLSRYRKSSIVPTHLAFNNTQEENESKLKDLGFTDEYEDRRSDVPGATTPTSPKQTHGNLATDLLHDHERLFTKVKHNRSHDQGSHSTRTNSLDPITTSTDQGSDKSKSELRLGHPLSSPTTTLEASSVFKDSSITSSIVASGDNITLHNSDNGRSQSSFNELNGNGTIIDFYQRELLLFKNELEFSSYMQHLNKHLYLREKNVEDSDVEPHSRRLEEESTLVMVVEGVKNEWKEKQLDFNRQYDLLIAKIAQVESERDKLSTKLLELQQSTETKAREYDELVKEIIPNKDYEIEQLKLKVKTSESGIQELNARHSKDKAKDVSTKELTTSQKSLEDQIYNYKMEHQVLNQQLAQLQHENTNLQTRYNSMISQYESKLEKSKLSLSETLATLTTPFEKRIAELQAVIYKYQTLLEDQTRNSKLATPSLNGAVPIPIIRQNSSNSSGNYSFDHDSGHGNNTMPSRSLAPIQQMVRNGSSNNKNGSGFTNDDDSLPLMRGRGGLQKRTRKFM